MNESEKFQRAVKAKLIEVMDESSRRRGHLLSGELIAALMGLSFKTIFRIKENAEYLPSPEIAPALERLCDDVKTLRGIFRGIMEVWDSSVFACLPKEVSGILRFMFDLRYLAILQNEKMDSDEKVEALTVEVLKDHIKKIREDQLAAAPNEAARQVIEDLRARLEVYEGKK